MKKETSLKDVKALSKGMLKAIDIKPDHKFEFIVQHPFTNSPYSISSTGEMLDLRTEEGYEKWIATVEQIIDETDLLGVFAMVNNPWNLTWLKIIEPHLSEEDFSILLKEAWTNEENPNMDRNVSTAAAIKWFKKADKKSLMDEEEYTYWNSLPEEVVLYRGVANGRKEHGLSWTDNKDTAIWFQKRFAIGNGQGKLLRVKAKKKHCLCFLNSRDEKEIVLDVRAVKNDIEDITNIEM